MNTRLLAGFCLAAAAMAQTMTREAIEHARAGVEAQKQGNLDQAIQEFRAVTQIQPDLAAAFVNLGATYVSKRDYPAAITALERAVSLNPDLIGAHQMLGTALLSAGRAAEAIPHLEKAKIFDLLGIAYLEDDRLGDAIGMLGTALNAHANDPDLLYYFGRATALASKESFDRLLASAPDHVRARQAMAEQYEQLRQPSLAEKEYREAIRLRPDLPGLHLALGKLLAAKGDWPGAEIEFREESKLRPEHAETAWRAGSALLQEGKAGEALAELRRADSLRPDMPETLLALGKAAWLSADAALAEKSWSRVVEIEKDSDLASQAHFELSALYRRIGRPQDADRELAAYRKNKGAKN